MINAIVLLTGYVTVGYYAFAGLLWMLQFISNVYYKIAVNDNNNDNDIIEVKEIDLTRDNNVFIAMRGNINEE